MEKQQEADKEQSPREQAAAKWESKAPPPEQAEDKPQREKADRETERDK